MHRDINRRGKEESATDTAVYPIHRSRTRQAVAELAKSFGRVQSSVKDHEIAKDGALDGFELKNSPESPGAEGSRGPNWRVDVRQLDATPHGLAAKPAARDRSEESTVFPNAVALRRGSSCCMSADAVMSNVHRVDCLRWDQLTWPQDDPALVGLLPRPAPQPVTTK